MSDRESVLQAVAEQIVGHDPGRPVLVGIDGVCGAGKSTFARDLVSRIESTGRPAVHLDSDGFHHPSAHRRRRTDDQARGYYDDAYDFDALAERVLRPLRAGATTYATAVLDLQTDEVLDATAEIDPRAVLLFDCTFLQRGALRDLWDEVIWLETDLTVARARGVARDAERLGGAEAAGAAHDARYLAACRIYLAEESPQTRASIVIDHDDPSRPVVRSTARPHSLDSTP